MREIIINNLTYTVGGATILDNLSLKIPARKFVGLLGPNGCGKSTLLKHLYRVLPVKSGQVRFDDEDLTAIPLRKAAQCIGVMAQFNTVNFDFTILQLVLMGRTPFKKGFDDDTDEDYALAEAALRRVGLWDRAYRRFSTLSGGEQQRVLLARVLCQEPEYLILDEPTNHLDITYQLELLAVIKELGIGVLAALHDLNLAAMFCGVLWLAWNNGVTARSDVATHDGIPQRVIVTYPGATELLIDLGLEKHIVGTVAPYGEEPPQYKKAYEALPILSGFVPSRETVWQLQPDLIIGWSHHFKPDALGDEAQWSSRGVNTYIVPATIRKGTPTLESTVYPFIDDMGRLFHQEAKAAAYKEGLMARVATVEKRTATMTKHPTVMILQSHGRSTYSLYGPIYIIDDVVKKAGGVNVTNHQISQVGPERVLTYDPDVIVDVLVTSDKGTFRDDAAALAELRADPNLQDLRAVREGRVIAVPFGDINNGNGRVVNALEHISERLNQLMQS